MTKIALIGYGAMGKEIHGLAEVHGCTVVQIFDADNPLSNADFASWDVAVDFSSADAIAANVELLCSMKKNMVIGTTGWNSQQERIHNTISKAGVGCVVGSNFSVGMQIFLRLTRTAAALLNSTPDYDIMVHEWHHKRKADSPSGTALTIANIVIGELDRKKHVATETMHQPADPEVLHVTSTRGGEIPGRHTVTIDGPFDRIDLIHDARNRSGFASGALRAAQWIHGKNGLYRFDDIFSNMSNSSTEDC